MSQAKIPPKVKPNQPTRRGPKKSILASSSVTIGADPMTHLIAPDIFNEPTRERLEMGGNKWVRFFDQNDTFLKSLIAVVNNSPTLRRIINDKTNMVVGDGFIPMTGRSNSMLTTNKAAEATLNPADLNAIEDCIEKVNMHGHTLQEVLGMLAFDYDAFGNCFAELVQGDGFCYLYHVPIYMIGLRRAGEDRVIRSVGIYDNWEEVPLASEGTQYAEKGFREVPMYPEFSPAIDGLRRSIIHVKQYAAGYFYFGLPEWIGAKMWAEIEYRIQRFNTSKFQNGFMPSGFLQFFGSMSPQEATKMLAAIEKKFTGSGNNHEIFMQVVRDEKLKANWVPMTVMQDGEFMDLQTLAASAIVVANRWSKSLAGFATEGQLGTNQQIRQEMEYLQNTVIKQRQNVLLSRVINPYLKVSSESGAPIPAGLQFGVSNSLPVSFMGEISVENALTTDEKREVLGYGPAETQQQPAQNPAENGTDTII